MVDHEVTQVGGLTSPCGHSDRLGRLPRAFQRSQSPLAWEACASRAPDRARMGRASHWREFDQDR